MCGIFGYVGNEPCLTLLGDGLGKLEYRGYDSTGIMVYDQTIQVAKTKGRVSDLLPTTDHLSTKATIGLGHTRWASHGKATLANAHPHYTDQAAIVHNGIIENHSMLRAELDEAKVSFKSETDTEVVLHAVEQSLARFDEPLEAFANIVRRIEGLYAIAIFLRATPDRLYLCKKGASLVIAEGADGYLFSSDPVALAGHCQDFIFLGDQQIAELSIGTMHLYDYQLHRLEDEPRRHKLQLSVENIDKGDYQHFMLKEIHQQGSVLANTIHRLFDFDSVRPRADLLGFERLDLDRVQRIKVTGCGTSHHAGMLSPYFVEQYLQTEASVEVAHELRYRPALLDDRTLLIALSQSGETADTLSCVEHAKKFSCQTLAICNNPHSSLTRLCDAMVHLDCGMEVGVASTKAFTSMLLTYYMFVLSIRHQRNHPPSSEIYNLRKLPLLVDYVLNSTECIEQIAQRYYQADHFIFIGRGPSYPIALEAALKLKETSYIHAEGYAGGELKHGPLALIDSNLPVLVIAPADNYLAKTLSNAKEIKARDGQIIILGNSSDRELQKISDEIIPCPYVNHPILQAIVSTIPLQLFAYYMATARGTDIDQPRHLAKSVTVE